jgi:hypothetical protein
MLRKRYFLAIGILFLYGCASTSGVMEAENGTYLISAKASPARGGTAGANALAYEEAQKFCATAGGRAVLVNQQERDVYQGGSAASANQYGAFSSSGVAAGGAATINFRCIKK